MSSRILGFTPKGWQDYLYWQETDKKMVRRLNRLIAETLRTPFTGPGKPEPLKRNLSGLWSRRINDEHRLIYKVSDSEIQILACRYHYS